MLEILWAIVISIASVCAIYYGAKLESYIKRLPD